MKNSTNKVAIVNGLKIHYADELGTGGLDFGLDFLDLFAQKGWKADRVFEMCSGPGYIGFALLANNLCNSLCLADINPVAVEACKRTIAENGLSDRVNVYLSDGLADIPKHEQWDIIVGNPPQYAQASPREERIGRAIKFDLHERIWLDDDWHIHRDLYTNAEKHLVEGGQIVIMEARLGSDENDFIGMIREAGLTYEGRLPCPGDRRFYYVHSRRPS
ncbi:MAG: tRNA (adenine(22)-N(1))-methyltransferase TrmK [Magnetococcales bacterium]|nr:tRNA (adenine(22)-N(1))-methyltransferase TrmK [Magnetococcales bacterium]